MHPLRRFLLIGLAGSFFAFGQSYTIHTIAGTGSAALPVNTPATSVALGTVYGVAVDSRGNIFVPLYDRNIVVRSDAATGILTLVAGTGHAGYSGDNGPAISAQLNSPIGVAVDAAGNLYVSDYGNSRVRKVTGGVITTVAGNGSWSFGGDNGPATSAQLSPSQVAVDSSGNLYIADGFNNRIRKVSAGVITTVAGNGTQGFSGDNGPATGARLKYPQRVALDAAGNLYISDTGNNRIRRVSAGVITTVVGGGTSPDNGPAISAALYMPCGIAVDSAGSLYIADQGLYRIRKVSGGVITTVAGNGPAGSGGDNGPAVDATFSVVYDVAVDSAGNLYITDYDRIRKISAGVITTVAGNGFPPSMGFSGDNGPATSAQLNRPMAVAVDQVGVVYIADTLNERIRKVSNGVIATVAGSGTQGFSGDHGPATGATLHTPRALAVDSTGNLYIADSDNQRVRKVSNGAIATVAGNGSWGSSGDNSPATSAQFRFPYGVAVDSAGNMYIADFDNNLIRKVVNGVITTVTGNRDKGGFSGDNGPATSAGLLGPVGVAVDFAGNLYIADSGNNRVRKVANGLITTVAGRGTAGFSGDGGPAISAQLNDPEGVAVDFAGNLYIADSQNGSVRKVTNGVITTVAGKGKCCGFSGDGGPATSAYISNPQGIAVDSAGNVYVADSGNNRIRILIPSSPPCPASITPANLQPPTSGGSFTFGIQLPSSCFWTISGLPNWIAVSGTATGTGPATVTLVIAANTGAARSAAISIAGVTVQVTQDASPSINAGGVVNSASNAGGAPLAPGSLATAYGNFLLTAGTSATGTPLPTSLSGLSVRFGADVLAPLFYVGAAQVNLQVPWELAGQSQVALTATLDGRTGAAQRLILAPYSPGIFSVNSQGTGQGDIFDLSYRLVDSTNPAIAGGTVVQIYATGLGAVTNAPRSGAASPSGPLAETTTTPLVTIGGVPATVLFSGLAPGLVGVYQINVQVPAAASRGPAVPVFLSIGGATSNTVSIAVQ